MSRNLDDVPYLERAARNAVTASKDGEIKIGSRVRIINAEGDDVDALNHHIGEVATVIVIASENSYSYALEFDECDFEFHSAGGRGRSGRCYWVYAENVELVKNEGGAETCA